ncbi:MAG: hypothetical protein M3162_06070 [Thermoproteota archaeon]|nr:hypothetical protein [Thermoproteota archaeon]
MYNSNGKYEINNKYCVVWYLIEIKMSDPNPPPQPNPGDPVPEPTPDNPEPQPVESSQINSTC